MQQFQINKINLYFDFTNNYGIISNLEIFLFQLIKYNLWMWYVFNIENECKTSTINTISYISYNQKLFHHHAKSSRSPIIIFFDIWYGWTRLLKGNWEMKGFWSERVFVIRRSSIVCFLQNIHIIQSKMKNILFIKT